MNFGDMKTQFTGLLRRNDITPALKDTFFQQGIALIQRDLRIPPMEKSVSITQDGSYGVTGVPIPADLIELISISLYDTAGNFVRVITGSDLQTALRAARTSGLPEFYARQGSNYVLGPVMDIGDVVRVDYYAELPALAADSDTNVVTRIAPDLFIYAALSYAADYYLDKRTAVWAARYQSILSALQDQADLDDLTAAKSEQPAYDLQDDLWA